MFSPTVHNKANAKPSNSSLFKKAKGNDAFIQAKLNVGKPGDKYEVEADTVADKVVSKSNKSSQLEGGSSFLSPATTPTIQKQEDTDIQEKSIAQNITPTVQSASAEEDVQKMEDENIQAMEEENVQTKEEETVQAKEEGEEVQTKEEETIQSKEEDIQNKEEEDVQAKLNISKPKKANLSSRIQSAKGQGNEMPSTLKSNMETGFGADFSGVRVHTGSESVQMNKDLGAKAFTNKNDIFFNEGKFSPESKDGQTLIAHELTHTIQQGASKPIEKGQEALAAESETLIKASENAQSGGSVADLASGKEEAKAVDAKVKEGAAIEKVAGKEGANGAEAKNGEGKKEAAPVTTTPRSPKDDPNFKKLEGRLDKTGKAQGDHEAPEASASAAQSAAVSPSNERESMAQSGQVDAMAEAEPGTFNAADFKAKLMERIEGMKLPENQEAAANFDENNNIDEVNNAAAQDVEGEKTAAAGPVAETTQQEPNVAAIPEREVKPLAKAPVGKKPGTANPSAAMPPKRGDAEVNKPLQDNMSEVDQQMSENQVTDNQLAKSNEPAFMQGLDAKGKAKEDTENAPAGLRKQEEGTLQNAKAGAKGKEQTGLVEMHQVRGKLLTQVTGSQTKTGANDTSERTRIATAINGIYEKSKTDVEKILGDLDTNVKTAFKAGTTAAKKAFEKHVDLKMSAYKSRRYSGVIGAGRWLKDKFAGMPDEVNDFFVTGRQVYVDVMDKVITKVAEYVATKLTEAKTRVTRGKQEVKEYVESLPENLQKLGKEAAEEINDKFDELEDSVNSKQDELVDSLAEQYMEGLNAVDARIEEMKAANRGLIDAALGFINGIIETIKKLKELITTLLAEIQNAMGVIMEDPIGFVSTLFEGVGKGIDMFMANIQKHLLGGFVTWLTGAMGPVGITIPDDLFSLKGIFSLVMQVLGLSWDFMRKKSVLLMGEPMVAAMEKGFEMFQIIKEKGVSGMWEYMKDQFTDLKETIIESIKSMLITQVIEAGIKWLLSLLIPGAGFIKAIMAIKDLIVFFVESAIMLIPSLIQAIKSLASGNVAGVSKAIEKGLAMLLPLVIGLFAKLIGLGGLVKKVQKIIKKVRKRIDRAVTKLIKKAKKAGKKLLRKLGIGKKKKKKKGKDAEKGDGEIGKTIKFSEGKEKHKLWVQDNGEAELMVASKETKVSIKLKEWKGELNAKKWTKPKKERVKGLINEAQGLTTEADKQIDVYEAKEKEGAKAKKDSASADKAKDKADDKIESNQDKLKKLLKSLFEVFGENIDFSILYESELNLLHNSAKSTVMNSVEILSKDEENRSKIRSYSGLTDKLKETTDTNEIYNRPVNNDLAYGKFVRKQVEKAGKEELKEKYNEEKKKKVIAKINSPGTLSLSALKKAIFNGSIFSDAYKKIKALYKSKIHNKFKPVGWDEKPNGKGKIITYHYAEGKQSFEVEVNEQGYATKAFGSKLTLHDFGRGTTQDPVTGEKQKGMDSAHLIANMFGGSGYTKGRNLVLTSAHYNQVVMLAEENNIKKFVLLYEGQVDHFNMSAEVSYVEDESTIEFAAIKEKLNSLVKEGEEKEMIKDEDLIKKIKANLKASKQKRVKRMDYVVTLFNKEGQPFKSDNFKVEVADLLYGA